MLDKGFMAEARAKTMQQGRERRCTQLCSSQPAFTVSWKNCEELRPKPKAKWNFVDQTREETKHRTEWCADANMYRCIRCGEGIKYNKMPGLCTGPKYLSKKTLKNGESVTLEVMIW